MTSDSPRVRFGVVGIVTLSLFAALFARLWFLQVMTAPEYQVAAENNRVRIVQQEAPRGRILDRKANVLVDNRRSIVVTIDWQRFTDMDQPEQGALLARLARRLTEDRQLQALGAVPPGDPGAIPGPETTATTEPDEPTTSAPESTTTTSTVPEGTISTEPVVPEPVTVDQLRARLADARFSHFKPVPVATEVSEDLEISLTEHAEEYPTVAVERITVRDNRYGQLLAHVLGYVGAINEEELEATQNNEKPYELDDEIGKTGIERSMEARLRGVPGEVRYEVDARNRLVRRLPGGRAPVPGDDVYLSIDIDLQYLTEKSLAAQIALQDDQDRCDSRGCFDAGKEGSVVVTDPRNGEVLAMASYPTYDPAEFVGGISTAAYDALNAAGNRTPIVNKAIAGQYAPGSTWKLFSAHAGLANGQIDPGTQVNDPGYYDIPDCGGDDCELQGYNRTEHGSVGLAEALTVSSDVYFYKLGDDMWRRRDQLGDDALARTYQQWGFGADTGIGIVGEEEGRTPTPASKRELAAILYDDPAERRDNEGWFAGDNMITAIGQGDVLVTPLQLASAYGTFANGGTRYVPHLVLQVTKGYSETAREVVEPEVAGRVELAPDWRAAMLDGFKGVTLTGTATTTFEGYPHDRFPIAGKTGTAQVQDKADTSLFVGFAPADAPRFSAAAILPEAGNGGDVAAPLIRRILEPVALVGGNLALLPKAPLGGAFDAVEVIDEVEAPPSETAD